MGGIVRLEKEGPLAWVVFDHPERRNAISVEMWRQIPGIAAEIDADPGVRVAILRGAGEVAFVSGADISEFESTRAGAEASRRYEEENARAFGALLALDKPLLAMVHGYCVGGGLALALTADLRYAADDARFGVPAARLGLGYSPAGLELLDRLVGPSVAAELFFTARRFPAETMARKGLVNEVYPKAELEARVREIAREIAENAPLTIRSVKCILRELGRPAAERDRTAIENSVRVCFESRDYREGVRAFLEKRKPIFEGR